MKEKISRERKTRVGYGTASSLVLIILLTCSLLGITAFNVQASVSGTLALNGPDVVAPGGAIDVDASGLMATGGTVYFYLSVDDDPEISSGDTYFVHVDNDDLDDSMTLFTQSTLEVGEYYLKASDIKRTGASAVVSDEAFEVPEELPTVTIEPTSGFVGDQPTIEGKDAEDYATFEFYWNYYNAPMYGPEDLDDGEFTVEEDDEDEPILSSFPIPNGYEGLHKIIVLFTQMDGDTLSMVVEFIIVPDISVNVLSIEADSDEDQFFTITGTGFPEGTLDADTTTLTVKDFMTGSSIESYDTVHDEVEVNEDMGFEGTLEVEVTVVEKLEAGKITLSLNVDGATRTFEKDFFASAPTDVADFTTIKYGKADKTEGKIGDKVKFTFINLPSDAAVVINMVGETVTMEVVDGTSDINGAFKFSYKLADLPGGSYDVRASVTADGTTREKKIATFKVLPEFVISDADGREISESEVGTRVLLRGTGFPADSTIENVLFGYKEIDFDDVETGDTGAFTIEEVKPGEALAAPHISGGGLSVTVTVKGKDSEGAEIQADSSIIVKPKLLAESQEDWEVGILTPEGDWEAFDTGLLFSGSPLRLVGWGFLGGEAVTVQLYDEDNNLIGSAIITSGEEAGSNGDLELVCIMPAVKALYPDGEENVYLNVAGSTSSNNAELEDLNVAPASDTDARLYFGLEADGELKTKRKVGDSVKVLGAGFRTQSLNLVIPEIGEEVKSVTATYGYFETTVELPEMEGEREGKEYTLEEYETGIETSFYIRPNLALVPNQGYGGDGFTTKGTGFTDGADVDIIWVGAIEETKLGTVDEADVEDGSFTIELEAPITVARVYKVKAMVSDEEWASARFTVGATKTESRIEEKYQIDITIKAPDGSPAVHTTVEIFREYPSTDSQPIETEGYTDANGNVTLLITRGHHMAIVHNSLNEPRFLVISYFYVRENGAYAINVGDMTYPVVLQAIKPLEGRPFMSDAGFIVKAVDYPDLEEYWLGEDMVGNLTVYLPRNLRCSLLYSDSMARYALFANEIIVRKNIQSIKFDASRTGLIKPEFIPPSGGLEPGLIELDLNDKLLPLARLMLGAEDKAAVTAGSYDAHCWAWLAVEEGNSRNVTCLQYQLPRMTVPRGRLVKPTFGGDLKGFIKSRKVSDVFRDVVELDYWFEGFRKARLTHAYNKNYEYDGAEWELISWYKAPVYLNISDSEGALEFNKLESYNPTDHTFLYILHEAPPRIFTVEIILDTGKYQGNVTASAKIPLG